LSESPRAEAPAAAFLTERLPAAPAQAPSVEQFSDMAPPVAARKEERAMERAKSSGAAARADVVSVSVRGSARAYEFTVGIRSPDTGCAQYADWWEVVSEDGKLLYRRVLLHSHVDEQPFTRSGGPVPVEPDTVVWVRAHMNTAGYGGVAFKGSVKTGFARAEPPANFAAGLAKQAPLPDGCDF
jgi:hypothetical protein